MVEVLAPVGHFLRGTIHCIVEWSSDGLGLVVRMAITVALVTLFSKSQEYCFPEVSESAFPFA
jgi:hypothetical protein